MKHKIVIIKSTLINYYYYLDNAMQGEDTHSPDFSSNIL
jgi:hypothetical protein